MFGHMVNWSVSLSLRALVFRTKQLNGLNSFIRIPNPVLLRGFFIAAPRAVDTAKNMLENRDKLVFHSLKK